MLKTLIGAAVLCSSVAAQAQNQPIIDMHFHVMPANANGPDAAICAPFETWPIREPDAPIEDYLIAMGGNPDCERVLRAPKSDEELQAANLAILEKRNIIALAGGKSGPVQKLKDANPDRIIPALNFGAAPNWPSVDEIRALHAEGKIEALAEITIQYAGISPSDPRMAPYWSVAEELDLPVGLHMGPTPPGVAYFGSPEYRMSGTDPLQLEDVLLKHPNLRVFVMHAGWPMGDRMIALMFAHPHVYVEIGVIDFVVPEAAFHSYLKRLVDAGFGKRIMFGSDQMVWPEAIEIAIDRIESADYLSTEQKRDILYNNAARFLRLSNAEIAAHHSD